MNKRPPAIGDWDVPRKMSGKCKDMPGCPTNLPPSIGEEMVNHNKK